MDMRAVERYGCAVLAGGEGRRMGQVNKAELGFNGRSFLEHIASELEKTGMKGYLSVANYDQTVPENWTPVRDCVTRAEGGFVGPAGGILSCLMQAEKDGLEGLFFAPCDAPFFDAALHGELAEQIDDETDAVFWRTRDGRIQTTFGWYSVRCIPAFRDDVASGKYKILRTMNKLRCRILNTEDSGIDERCFMNVNSPEDYRRLAEARRRHILICGKKQVGKSTLVNRVIESIGRPVYGFRTKASEPDENGVRHVYMYPAQNVSPDDPDSMTTENHIGDTCGKVLDVNTEVFDRLGVSLIREAKDDGVLIMDELGFMEENARAFCDAVLDALDSDIPVLATVKDTDKNCGFLEAVRNHPRAVLLMIDEENRDELFGYVRDISGTW